MTTGIKKKYIPQQYLSVLLACYFGREEELTNEAEEHEYVETNVRKSKRNECRRLERFFRFRPY